MPLVILTGFPSSGKSTRANQLKLHLTEKLAKTVVLLSENDIVRDKIDHAGNTGVIHAS